MKGKEEEKGQTEIGAAFDAALAALRLSEPVVDLGRGERRAIVPPGFRLEDVSDPHRLAPHVRKRVSLHERTALVAYVNRFRDGRSVIFADFDHGLISARLDWHEAADAAVPLAPQPCEHEARLLLRPSEEYRRWSGMEGKMHPQAEFAAFLEENAEDIVEPEPATMIEISRDLEAAQGVNFKASVRLESGDRALVYETETRVKGEITVPREFRVSIPLYQGEEPVTLRCAFRYRIGGGGLSLGFEWRRVEYLRQAHFRQIAYAVSEETGCPVYLGSDG